MTDNAVSTKGVAASRCSPREVCGQDSIVKDVSSAHLACGQVAHGQHHGIPARSGKHRGLRETERLLGKLSKFNVRSSVERVRNTQEEQVCLQVVVAKFVVKLMSCLTLHLFGKRKMQAWREELSVGGTSSRLGGGCHQTERGRQWQ